MAFSGILYRLLCRNAERSVALPSGMSLCRYRCGPINDITYHHPSLYRETRTMPVSFTLILFFVFLALILIIAFWGMRQTTNTQDFFLGGKTLGPWILAISYGATYFSAVIFVGFAGQFGWRFGLSALWIGIANAVIGGGLAWLVLGGRTRRMTHNLSAMTMPEFFSSRYGSKNMKFVSALVIFVFLLPYSASVYKGIAYMFEIVLDNAISFEMLLVILTAMSFVYVTFGGYKAIARIDFLLGAIMILGSMFMAGILISKFGSLGAVLTGVPEKLAERMSLPEGNPLRIVHDPAQWYILPSVVFMTSFGVWGMPQMIHKFYAISDAKEIWRGAVITTIFAGVIGCAAYLTGAMSHLMPVTEAVQPQAVASSTGDAANNSDTTATATTTFPQLRTSATGAKSVDFDKLVPDLLHAQLPQFLMAVILLLILAASLSTLSSLVLVSASAVTIDLYKSGINPSVSGKKELLIMRFFCGLFIILAFLIALRQPAWIVTLMSLSWGSVAGAFLAPYMYGLFWKRTTRAGAWAGMITGLLVSNGTFIYLSMAYDSSTAQRFSTVTACAAMVIPFLIVPIVSLATKPPQKEAVDKAFE